ncbi:DUF3828 domain-containing protein [Rhodopseudomonas sp. P2A-2r]|uniref:DUF3828 domain-containing protein n=1 Tax=unclassified Rhodopseudomonas TaxID=2638247 RepID=UPI002234977D|nr:DUF3828 domain-containing protein [Rhodopseudomonas sp. P2A-2r]UZE47100.1 DUF3828 domain-containing protein [Rhodopseudomonas sp. P2A-2r]
MLARRAFVVAALALLATPSAHAAPVANDPLAIVNAIYARVTAGKGDEGGGFVTLEKPARAKYLSKSLAALWNKAEARTPKGEVGPVDFDPVTNSQNPDVKSFTATAEKLDAALATVAVALTSSSAQEPRKHAEDNTIRYDFVRDGGHWKIDDIRGAVDGEAWSVRQLLTDSLKT